MSLRTMRVSLRTMRRTKRHQALSALQAVGALDALDITILRPKRWRPTDWCGPRSFDPSRKVEGQRIRSPIVFTVSSVQSYVSRRFIHFNRGNLAKSLSVAHSVAPCSMARSQYASTMAFDHPARLAGPSAR